MNECCAVIFGLCIHPFLGETKKQKARLILTMSELEYELLLSLFLLAVRLSERLCCARPTMHVLTMRIH